MRRRILSPLIPVVAVVLSAVVPHCAALAGENYAFLVSVRDYDEKELRPLQFTRNDLQDFRRTLRNSGFRDDHIVHMHDDVQALENRKYLPEAEKIRQQFGLLLGSVEEGDTLVVAFAGHGVQFRGDEQSYFCPADARLADRDTLISFQQVYAALKECRAGRKLLLVDACRDDPQSVLSRSRATINLESVTRPQREAVPEGIVALFSCSPGQQSYEHPPLQHGIFFHHVLKAWSGEADGDRDGRVTFDELAGFVKRETSTYARRHLDVLQTPHLKSDAAGDWVLRTVAAPLSKESAATETVTSKAPAASSNTPSPSAQDALTLAENNLLSIEKALTDARDRYQRNQGTKDEIDQLEKSEQTAKERRDAFKGKGSAPPQTAFIGRPTQSTPTLPPLKKLARTPELKKLDAELVAAQKELKGASETLARRRTVLSNGQGGRASINEALREEAAARGRVESVQQQIFETEVKQGFR
jgi:uncharacterized caspase-like protein